MGGGERVKTVVFYRKGSLTRKFWYCQLEPDRSMGKTNPLSDGDSARFVKLLEAQSESPESWSVSVKGVDQSTFDLSVKNPNGGEVVVHRTPQDIIEEIVALDAESADVLASIRALL